MYDRERGRRYYHRNKEKIKEYNRQWRKKRRFTHPHEAVRQNERVKRYHKTEEGKAALKAGHLNVTAKKRGQRGSVSKEDILKLWEIYKCKRCDCQENLQIDHIKPAMHGGLNVGENLQLLCVDCHKEKTREEMGIPKIKVEQEEDIQLELKI